MLMRLMRKVRADLDIVDFGNLQYNMHVISCTYELVIRTIASLGRGGSLLTSMEPSQKLAIARINMLSVFYSTEQHKNILIQL